MYVCICILYTYHLFLPNHAPVDLEQKTQSLQIFN